MPSTPGICGEGVAMLADLVSIVDEKHWVFSIVCSTGGKVGCSLSGDLVVVSCLSLF